MGADMGNQRIINLKFLINLLQKVCEDITLFLFFKFFLKNILKVK
jgi:hypothetical protein